MTPTSPILVCRASRDDCTDCQRALWCSVCATQMYGDSDLSLTSTPLVDERPSILKVESRFQRRACAPRSSTWSQDVNIPCWLEGIPEPCRSGPQGKPALCTQRVDGTSDLCLCHCHCPLADHSGVWPKCGSALPLLSSCDKQPSVGPSMRIIWACFCPLFACCCSRLHSTKSDGHEDLQDKHMFTCVYNSAVLECEARHSCEC